jgi:endonuclease I
MKKIKLSLSAVALSVSVAVFADIPTGYYDNVNTASPAELKQSLHEIIRGHTRFPYTSDDTDTWDILEAADEHPELATHVIDVYKNASYQKQNGGNDFYNREHSWPKSYGFPDNGDMNYPYTDAHHLFISDSAYNSARSNKPFASCGDSCATYETETNAGRGGTADEVNRTEGDYSDGKWETWSGRRGDVARALLYMAVRYEGGVHTVTGAMEPDLELTNNVELIEGSRTGDNENKAYMGYLSTLVEWHVSDPVDDVERSRNDVVYSHQTNRNPFIDHPEYVDCIFKIDCTSLNGQENDTTAPADVTGTQAVLNGESSVDVTWTANSESDVFAYRVTYAKTDGSYSSSQDVMGKDSASVTITELELGTEYSFNVIAVDNYFNESSGPTVNVTTGAAPTTIDGALWINEIHYDNASSDKNEFVEVAGPIATDTAGWTVVLYNGNGGKEYATLTLDSALGNESNGMGFIALFPSSIQNGGPDGLALVNPEGGVVQFLSYEGVFKAEDGPAAGLQSVDIGVEESGGTTETQSMQLTGEGSDYASFTWQANLEATAGKVNESQTFPATGGSDGGDGGSDGDDGTDGGDTPDETEEKKDSGSSMSWWMLALTSAVFWRRHARK